MPVSASEACLTLWLFLGSSCQQEGLLAQLPSVR
jgi:hypothetical protein